MPIYAYKCSSCQHEVDALQKIADAPLTDCPQCGAPTLVKQLTAAGFQLKGSGWYATDFKNGPAKPKADAKPAEGAPAPAASAAPGAAAPAAPKDGAAPADARAAGGKDPAPATPAAPAAPATGSAASGT